MTDLEDAFRSIFKGAGVVVAGIVLEMGISFVGKIIIAQKLGKDSYGSVSLGITILLISSIVITLGLDVGISRYLPRFDKEAKRRGVLVSGFRLVVVLSVVVAIGMQLLTPWLAVTVFDAPESEPVIRVFVAAIPFAVLMKYSVGAIGGMKDSLPKVLIENLTLPGVRFIGVVLAVLLGLEAVGVASAYLLSYVCAMILGLAYLVRRTSLFDFSVDYEPMGRTLLRFSAPLVITSAMTAVMVHFDTLLVGAFLTNGAVGEYNVVYPLAQLITVPLTAFGFLFVPVFSELDAKEGRDLEAFYQTTTKWVFVCTFPIFAVLALFPELSIGIPFGQQYVPGSLALIILSSGFLVDAVAGLNENALTSFGLTQVVMYDNVAATVLNVILNLILIPEFGIAGAALATAISYWLLNALYSYQLYQYEAIVTVKPSMLKLYLIAAGVTGVAFAVVSTLPVSRGVGLFVFGVVLAPVYVFIVTRYGEIGSAELTIIEGIEGKFDIDLTSLKQLVTTITGAELDNAE